MGSSDIGSLQLVIDREAPPGEHVFELTVFGGNSSYGESSVMHLGEGQWMIVDSFLDPDENPVALRYLDRIGVDPTNAVVLVVATHWHDDHIRGMGRLIEVCSAAEFCCASVLGREEFTTTVGALKGRGNSMANSGLREIYAVFSALDHLGRRPVFALANRVVFQRNDCTVTSLSPSDDLFVRFLKLVSDSFPGMSMNNRRVPDLSPNEMSVVLWIDVSSFSTLLGADMETSGWKAIIDGKVRPMRPASAFKVPHHGSANADEPRMWDNLLTSNPYSIVTPWRLGGRALPTAQDTDRIVASTTHAYATSVESYMINRGDQSVGGPVARTVRESTVRYRSLDGRTDSVRLRRSLDSGAPWTVELFGDARSLSDLRRSS